MDQDDVSYRPAMRPMTIVGYLLTNRELTDHWRICSSQNIGDSYEEANQPVHLFIKINKYYLILLTKKHWNIHLFLIRDFVFQHN